MIVWLYWTVPTFVDFPTNYTDVYGVRYYIHTLIHLFTQNIAAECDDFFFNLMTVVEVVMVVDCCCCCCSGNVCTGAFVDTITLLHETAIAYDHRPPFNATRIESSIKVFRYAIARIVKILPSQIYKLHMAHFDAMLHVKSKCRRAIFSTNEILKNLND